MPTPLKNLYGPEIPRQIAAMIAAIHPAFPAKRFLRGALDGYEELELTARARHISRALHQHLPSRYQDAITILVRSLGPALTTTDKFGMAPFVYLPHVFYVAEHGVDHFEESMNAQYELTQRFSAEFSIRVFLERYPDDTLDRLALWCTDESPHVRRLVSEGTRPRLPWAPRLRAFQRDPAPVIRLLEQLKDDSSLYVRRSVANNLNDIGKDNPRILMQVARRWLRDASSEREWVVRHALRGAVRKGDPEALALLGFGELPRFAVTGAKITPRRPRIGTSARITFTLANSDRKTRRMLVDYRVHFVRASGDTSPRVFKLTTVQLDPGQSVDLSSSISLRQMTTRTHHPGRHMVEAIVNGQAVPLGSFTLLR